MTDEKEVSLRYKNLDNKDDDELGLKGQNSEFKLNTPWLQFVNDKTPQLRRKTMEDIEKHALSQDSQTTCYADNFVMDFQMDIANILDPHCYQVNGVLSYLIEYNNRINIKKNIVKIWKNCHKELEDTYYLWSRYQWLYITFLGSIQAIPSVLNEQILPAFGANPLKPIYFGILQAIVGILFPVLYAIAMNVIRRKGRQWRLFYIAKLKKYAKELKDEYPELTFSLIYPIKIEESVLEEKTESFRAILVNLWCYIRVTKGYIDTDDTCPLMYTTYDGGIESHEYNFNSNVQNVIHHRKVIKQY